MTFPPDPLTDPLNDWLDARATGQVPPAAPDTDADFDTLLVTARRLDHLARQNEEAARFHRHRSSWEDTMTAANISASPSTPQPTYRGTAIWSPMPAARPTHHRWWKAALGAVAAVLLVSIGMFAFQQGQPTEQRLPGLSFDDQQHGSIPFSEQSATPAAELVWEAPDPADCTVEPLTVDQVMAILIDPNPSQGWYPTPLEGTPGPETENTVSRNPTTDEIATMQSVVTMYQACVAAESWMQMWALSTPSLVQEQVMSRLPMLVGEDEARATLELIAAGEPVDGFEFSSSSNPFVSSGNSLVMIDPNPGTSWVFDRGLVVAGIVIKYEGQDQLVYRTAQTSQAYGDMTAGPNYACTTYVFGLAEDEETWILSQSEIGCG